MTGELNHGSGPHSLTDIAHGPQTAGSFQFDETTMRKLVTDWLDLADSYESSRNASSVMSQVEGPGLDFASHAYASAASSSGAAYLQYLIKNRDYCRDQAELFKKALDGYLGVEHTAVTEIDKSGPQGSHPGII
jgi:hypothetical protein